MSSYQIIITDPDTVKFFQENDFLDQNKFIARLVRGYENEKKEKDQQIIDDNQEKKEKKQKIELTKDEIFTFYKEHKEFLDHKKTVLNLSRDFHQKLQSSLNTLKFDGINEFYTKNLNLEIPMSLTCDICKVFSVSTKKGLSAHQRKCRKTFLENNDVEAEDISSLDDDDDSTKGLKK